MEWLKEERMKELDRLIGEGKVDKDENVATVLKRINQREDSFTSSSCERRIGVMKWYPHFFRNIHPMIAGIASCALFMRVTTFLADWFPGKSSALSLDESNDTMMKNG